MTRRRPASSDPILLCPLILSRRAATPRIIARPLAYHARMALQPPVALHRPATRRITTGPLAYRSRTILKPEIVVRRPRILYISSRRPAHPAPTIPLRLVAPAASVPRPW